MFNYAQLNENNICVGISCLSGEVNQGNMIQIDSMSENYLYKKYEYGVWSTEKFEPETTTKLSEFEETKQRITDVENAIASIVGGVN